MVMRERIYIRSRYDPRTDADGDAAMEKRGELGGLDEHQKSPPRSRST